MSFVISERRMSSSVTASTTTTEFCLLEKIQTTRAFSNSGSHQVCHDQEGADAYMNLVMTSDLKRNHENRRRHRVSCLVR
jgi:hypothetical protein